MIEIPVYKAKCENCTKVFHAWMDDWRAQNEAEDHMMQTGHIVDVQEVV